MHEDPVSRAGRRHEEQGVRCTPVQSQQRDCGGLPQLTPYAHARARPGSIGPGGGIPCFVFTHSSTGAAVLPGAGLPVRSAAGRPEGSLHRLWRTEMRSRAQDAAMARRDSVAGLSEAPPRR